MSFDPFDDEQMDSMAEIGKKLAKQAQRISDLEAALRKVDEIRRELEHDYRTGHLVDETVRLINALRAPCMVVK